VTLERPTSSILRADALGGAIAGRRLFATLAATWACSLGTTLLTLGIYFYTAHEFGWGAALNMTLAAGQGAAYTLGALLADPMQRRFGARGSLIALHVTLGILAALAMFAPAHWQFASILLVYVFIAACNWPMLESLVTAGADAREMSRRVGLYNIVWASSGAVAVASAGVMIARWPAILFAVAVASHVISAIFVAFVPEAAPSSVTSGEGGGTGSCSNDDISHFQRNPHPNPLPEYRERGPELKPEPELLHVRTLALWLSRIALPASYVVNFSLSALLPSLPLVKQLSPTMQTLCGSVWLAARFASFVMLGKTIFWHTRPRILLGAAILMLIAFIGITIRPGISREIDLTAMIASQILLGLSMGMIYSASLYFGMVLSDGSTEHGGYHEALIGLGSVLGPGAGAATQYLWPGNTTRAVIAVSAIVGVCIFIAGGASFLIKRRD